MARNYENFDIEIAREGSGYVARIRSPRGEARAPFAVPLTDQEVRILGLTVARGRKTSRSVQTREVDEVKAYGQRLFDSLFTGDVLACYHESLSQTRGCASTGLRVRLRLADAPELAQVPWEYIFDRRSNRFLALEDETPIVRYLDLPLAGGALSVEPPLRVLVMISSPEDVPGLDTDEEWRRLNEALGDLIQKGAVQISRLEKASISALRWKLKEEEFHVFHFIGHGGVDAITERGVLLLEDENGRSDAVEAETIAGVLSAEKTLRLVVLNACEGGRASKGDIFAGTAQSLVQQDVPAVIAMQFEISDDAAITLTHDFYKSLSFGDPVDAALTEARRGLRYEKRNELEWGTPVLYMRATDGKLFDVKGALKPVPVSEPRESKPVAAAPPPAHEPPARARDRKIGELMHSSQVAAVSRQWSDAVGKLEQVLELDPGHEEATTRLAAVRKDELAALKQQTKAKSKKPLLLKIGAGLAAFWVLGIMASNLGQDPLVIDPVETGPNVDPAPAPQPQPEPAPQPAVVVDRNNAPSRDAEAAALGLRRYGPAGLGLLATGQSMTHPLTLEAGTAYVIAGSCDAACDDLDIVVSEQGVKVIEDTEPNAIPNVLVTVLLSGTYQLQVTMAECNAARCGYRVQVYRK